MTFFLFSLVVIDNLDVIFDIFNLSFKIYM